MTLPTNNRVESLRPSAAATWSVCTGSVAYRAAFPDAPEEADNEVCEDGTACHWLAAEIWQGRFPTEGSLSPNNRVLDEDMFDAVDMYHDVLRWPSWSEAAHYIEQPIDCSVIYPNMKGTPDAWAYRPGWLRVVDLKYGFRFVEVWDNLQLIVYVLAIAALLKLPDDTMVEMTIVQPRCNHRDGPVRTWSTRLGKLREKWLPLLQQKAREAMSPLPTCTPNPGCGDCAGRHACTALQMAAMVALDRSYSGLPLEMSAEAVGRELTWLKQGMKMMEARLTGLTVQAESMLRNGSVVPGWSLSPTFARERWKEGSEAAVINLGRYFNADLSKPQQPISPARARKLIPANVVAEFACKPSTGVRLTKQDPYEARKKFQSTNQE